MVAGIIAKAVRARIRGLFLAFPAILPASLTITEEEGGTRQAGRDAITAVLGGVALVIFATVGEVLFTRVNSALVLARLSGPGVVVSGILYAIGAVCRPDDCDKRLQ